jgi:hypothetical protein
VLGVLWTKGRHRYVLFSGAYANSGDETRALTMYAKEHTINAYMSYHSSGEVIMWPWGWTGDGVPDSWLHEQVGTYMASHVQRLNGGTYGSGPIYSAIYPVSGSSVDWFYSWNHWVGGVSCLSFTTELGTLQYQPVVNLDHMVHQNFKALKYLAGFCDSIVLLLEGVVPPPEIYELGSVGSNFTVAWHARKTEDNHPTHWELLELADASIIEDDLESDEGRWLLQGFNLSSARSHSGSHSFFSGNINEMNHAVRTVHPYPVEAGDSVTFWCWYNLETNYDVAVVEVSENTKEWFNLDTTRFNGNSGGWSRKAYSLEEWAGRSVYIRFRAMTDGSILNEGFYVDDVYPVCLFAIVDTVASDITDTLYNFSAHPGGEYFFMVRGHNSTWGWGDHSCLAPAQVGLGVVDNTALELSGMPTSLSLSPNPFSRTTDIRLQMADKSEFRLQVLDIAGRLVTDLSEQSSVIGNQISVIWDGRDDQGRKVSSGVYFIRLVTAEMAVIKKAVILR